MLTAFMLGLGWYFKEGAAGTAWLVGWSVYCGIYSLYFWFLMFRLDEKATKRHAQANDPGAYVMFVLVTLAASASLVAIIVAIHSGHTLSDEIKIPGMVLVFVSLAASWLVIQIAFTLHYARVYYKSPDIADAAVSLIFPNTPMPSYLDFFYYACVIGMTSQVSDVDVSGREMRLITLIHSLLSFGFNLGVLAIAVNVVASTVS